MEYLPSNVREQMEYVICGPHLNYHTTSSFASSTFNASAVDHVWSFLKFKEEFRIKIKEMSKEVMKMDLIGVHVSIANALRRIMIAEVPTMAIEHVFFLDNTGIVQDEVLAHRLGLVPIKADPRLFEWKKEDESSNERNCVVFKLEVECKKISSHVDDKSCVLSADLEWLPGGSEMPEETNCRFTSNQREVFQESNLQPVDAGILLTKLRPGQVIQLEAHCFKGIGKDHAKWSPVATAWYQLKPEVVLLKEVHGKKAQYLVEEFPGLFILETSTVEGKEIAKVSETYGHEHFLERIRELSGEDSWSHKIQLRKKKDHFLFTVESTGQYVASDIFSEALDVLIEKCSKLIESL